MRLLLTCHRDPFSYIGGSEAVVRALAMNLSQLGHQVTVLTRRDAEVPYHALYHDRSGEPLQMLIGPKPRVINVLTFEPNNKGPLETNRRLSDFMGFFEWDGVILYGQNVWVTDEVWRDVGRNWKEYHSHAKVLYFPVGFMGMLRKGQKRTWPLRFLYYHIVQDHLIEQADAVGALTDAEMGLICKVGRPKRLLKIPNGVDFQAFQDHDSDSGVRQRFNLPDGPLVLNVGGDYENKHLEDACQGIMEYNKFTTVKATLVMIGPGTEKYNNSFVKGLGIVPDADKVALYHEARLLLHTADFEGFGLVFLEALASGIPFVSTDVGAAAELAQQYGGHIIHQRNPLSIAYHLMNELETERDPDVLREVAHQYDWPVIAAQVEEAFV